MENKNIPDYVLKKGISKDDFVKIRDELKNMLLDDVLVKLNDYDDMIENIRKLDSSPKTDRWISKFHLHATFTDRVINNNVIKIEKIFNKILEDWEVYLTTKEEKNDDSNQKVKDNEQGKEEEVKNELDKDESLEHELIDDNSSISDEEVIEEKNVDEEPVLKEVTNIDTIEGDKDE